MTINYEIFQRIEIGVPEEYEFYYNKSRNEWTLEERRTAIEIQQWVNDQVDTIINDSCPSDYEMELIR